MAKADWGSKHTCQGCGAKYYDLNRSPITCPKCGTVYNPEAVLRSRRPRSMTSKDETAAAPAAPAVAAKAAQPDDLEVVDKELEVLVDDDEDGDEVIEDPSELGEDDTDVVEVEVVVEDGDDET